jgi:uncharacterized membrane protein
MTFKTQDCIKIVRFFAVLFCVLGIVFRTTNLDLKPFWEDEIYTLLRVSGITEAQVKDLILDRVISRDDVVSYLNVPKYGWTDSLSAMKKVPEHAPAYFFGLKGWLNIFPTTIANIRFFSVFLSCLSLPLFYWLGRELFHSSMVGWCTLGFASVSPILLEYAQESRPYSLWIIAILGSTIALVRAWRCETQKRNNNWIAYTLLIATSFYIHLLTFLLIWTHGAILIVNGIFKYFRHFYLTREWIPFFAILSKKEFRNFLAWLTSIVVSIFLALPWLIVVVQNHSVVSGRTGWIGQLNPTLSKLFINSLRMYSEVLFPRHLLLRDYFPLLLVFILSLGILLISYIFKKTNQSVSKYWAAIALLALVATPRISLLVADLSLGGGRSTLSRYAMISLIATVTILGAAFGLWLEQTHHPKRYVLGLVSMISVWSISIYFCGVTTQELFWMDKGDKWIIPVEQKLGADPQAILVLDNDTYRSAQYLSLLYSLQFDQNAIFFNADNVANSDLWSELDLDQKSLLLVNPSPKLQDSAQAIRQQRLGNSLSSELDIYYLPVNKL